MRRTDVDELIGDLRHLFKFLFFEPTALVPHEPTETMHSWWGDPDKINGGAEQRPPL